jgi:anti-anti-sigma factor
MAGNGNSEQVRSDESALFSMVEEKSGSESYVIRVAGELDGAVSEQLVEALGRAASFEPRGWVLLDMEKTSFVDSSGLRAILIGARDLNGAIGARFLVACDAPQVLRLFEITGTARHLEVFPNCDKALAALKGDHPGPV